MKHLLLVSLWSTCFCYGLQLQSPEGLQISQKKQRHKEINTSVVQMLTQKIIFAPKTPATFQLFGGVAKILHEYFTLSY